MIIDGWEIMEWDQQFSPMAFKQFPHNNESVFCGDDWISIERDYYDQAVVVTTVPVEVLRAYLMAYDKWKAGQK